MKGKASATIDEYIRRAPKQCRERLAELRQLVRQRAPEAEERISYRMPAYYLNGWLVYFAGFTNHIGFYPTASGIRAFEKQLSGCAHAKGSVQFPVEQPLPADLIKKIVSYRVRENLKRR
jgi:uncharacterized protein YdhG (YjbR/CyaY superfamily)